MALSECVMLESQELEHDEKRAHARKIIIAFAKTKYRGSSRSIDAFRNHFDSMKMFEKSRTLGVDWQELIGECIKDGTLRVTNGVVWVK